MTQAAQLLSLYDSFTPDQKEKVLVQFEEMGKAYPEKCNHRGGYTDLWLCAIQAIRDGKNPWL